MIHIACALDNAFTPYCVVTLYSVLENNQGGENSITFHILTNDMTEDNRNILLKMMNDYGQRGIIYDIDESVIKDFPVNSHIKIAAYFRFFLPAVLPDIDKVIYLDSDIIVLGNISELWDIDVTQFAVAGVLDIETNIIAHYNRLNYDHRLGYINSGVLIINLARWREDNFLANAISRIRSCVKKYRLHDQDFINEFYCNEKLVIDFRYNLMEFYIKKGINNYVKKSHFRAIEAAIKNPLIVHFCGEYKPWHYEYSSPIKHIFCKYADAQKYCKNVYKSKRSKKRILKDIFGNFIYRTLKFLKMPTVLSYDKTISKEYRTDIYHIEDY